MSVIIDLQEAIARKKQEIATLVSMQQKDKVFFQPKQLNAEEREKLSEEQLRAGAEAMMKWDPTEATNMLQRADQINANRDSRAMALKDKAEARDRSNADKADAQAQTQKQDALTELANIDANSPTAQDEWTAVRNTWVTKNPKLEAYLPAKVSFIDAKGNFGKLAERAYADGLLRRAQSEMYLAPSSPTTAERTAHLTKAAEYETAAKKYGAVVATGTGTDEGGDAFKAFISKYDAATKIPDYEKSQWTPAEQKIISDHNTQVDTDKDNALRRAAAHESLEAEKFANAVAETLGGSVDAAQKALEDLKRGASSVQSAVKNNNTRGAAYMSMKKALGDALSGADFAGMAGFGISEGVVGKLKEALGGAQISEGKAQGLVKSFIDGLNEAIREYNANVVTKTAKSELKDKIRNKYKIDPVPGAIDAPKELTLEERRAAIEKLRKQKTGK
jgi:hypothetical protein